MLHLKSRIAFTMIEAVFSLVIFSSIALATGFGIQNYQQRIEEKQTLESFKMNWHNLLNYSYLNKRNGEFIVNNDDRTMTFMDINDRKRYYHQINLPKTLHYLNKNDTELYVTGNGESRPRTVIFQSNLTKKKYTYTIQMFWGEVVEK
ncbi:type II secretion system protein [Companilactobacillus hulinensis]|uniref:type II secretion system protein n=1 Tax=Companilactobacillus hulinensis TaxID=2486007 RepID=UPI0013DE69D7|nr:type II secretion system protein [Companilactobacillus hulinensis]